MASQLASHVPMTSQLVLQAAGVCGRARSWKIGRLMVLSLAGTPEEIGYQHGVLARESADAGAVERLASAATEIDGIRQLSTTKKMLARLYVKRLYSNVWHDLAPEYRQEIAGLAKGLRRSRDAVFRASFLSEVLQMLAAGESSAREQAIGQGGCTAAVALGSGSTGGPLHGKNQDYDGAGHWDASPIVAICRANGSKAYAKVSSAGLIKGNLSLNEAGLSIGGHMLFSMHSGKRGRSFTALENDVMRRASSLGEAIDIFKRAPRIGCFAFVVTDGAANEAASIECDGDGVYIRPANDTGLAMSNIYTTEGADERDLLLKWHMDRNPSSRQRRADEMLAGLKSRRVQDIAKILADLTDPNLGRKRSIGHTIASIMTVTSAIAKPKAAELWVGEGIAPTSLGRFIGFDLAPAFDGHEPSLLGSFDTVEADEDRAAALRLWIAARLALEESRNEALAVNLLQQGRLHDPEETAFGRMIARIHLRAVRTELADNSLRTVDLTKCSLNERAEYALLGGHVADLRLDRKAAMEAYDRVLQLAEADVPHMAKVAEPIVTQARKFRSTPFDQEDARKLAVPMSLISGIE